MEKTLKLYQVSITGLPKETEFIAAYDVQSALMAYDWNPMTAGSDYESEEVSVDYIGEIRENAIVR